MLDNIPDGQGNTDEDGAAGKQAGKPGKPANDKGKRDRALAPKKGSVFIGSSDDAFWYKDAVIYQLHVKSFFDENNDGIGDFAGLIAKLDYIARLGVNTIWLLPFYPSPRRDDGYDIAEYKDVHEDYGSMADAKRFVAEAHKRGLRVITELVINHTSDQHPWFQRARAAKPGSAARNFYVWSDNDQGYAGTRIIFLDTEKSNWTWDPVANAYFWHRFYSHQPDLNFDNPAVLKAVLEVMSFWLNIGIDGLRLDAVPYLIEREGTSNENLPETHVILKKIRAHMDQNFEGRMLLAEANMWPEDVQQYFGNSDECQMAFHFPLMPRIYMALAQQDRFPITDILRQTPEIPADCQWAIFLRNHDELTLEMVTDKERDYLWNYYAADRRARINMGIRRRLAPLLERDRRRIELLNSLLVSMPGTPVIYYGDEIGMGDNIHLGDRDGVRTPMQWSPDRNGGFSRVDPAAMVLPAIMDPLYGYQAVNVEAQSGDPHSLLNWMRRLLEVRGKHRAFGRGSFKLLYPDNRKVLAYLREYKMGGDAAAGGSGSNANSNKVSTETILCVANVSGSSEAVQLDLSQLEGRVPIEMLGGAAFPPVGRLPYVLTLPPFGFYWFVLAENTELPAWYTPAAEPMPDYLTLVLRNGLDDLISGTARTTLEKEILPLYLSKRRWYSGKQGNLDAARIACTTVLPETSTPSKLAPATVAPPMLMAEIEVSNGGNLVRYLLPLGFEAEAATSSGAAHQLALARVRRDRRVGLLTDAFALDAFAVRILELIRSSATISSPCGEIRSRYFGTGHAADTVLPEEADIRRLSGEQSNSSLVIGESIVLKVLRRLTPGLHPEVEMVRFLTDHGYANTPPILGDMTRYAMSDNGAEEACTLVLLQAFVHNQGDAWHWTLDTLALAIHSIDVTATGAGSAPAPVKNAVDPLLELRRFATVLGERLGQLHSVLAQPSDDDAFSPQRAGAEDAKAWIDEALEQLRLAYAILQGTRQWDEDLQALVTRLLEQRPAVEAAVTALGAGLDGALRTRVHGDFHLGQVLVSSGDVYLVDFEGAPALSLAQRRQKNSPWRDVAGLLRSIDYAAAFADERGPGSIGPGDLSDAVKQRKAEILQNYVTESRDAFLLAYRENAPEAAHAADTALLTLFCLEKAAYELCYEAAHRPDWMEVPVRGLATLCERLLNP
ncbi:maltose alpha-D-glucosyltransferase [Undibacterium sp.]|uniref:maltose alpha-D-glucosyltransferase n=1 Tax=Undibacterium sp. TaxID=1914977 RepID=UPI00374CD8EE